MYRLSTRKTLTLAAVAAALIWTAPAGAFERPPLGEANECVVDCREANRACEAPVREALRACIEENGCDVLLDAARAACEADPESEECESARAAARECVAPCKEAQRSGLAECRSELLTCLREVCGLEDLPPLCPRGGRGR